MEFLQWMLPVLLGGLTTVAMQGLKAANAWVDGLPSFVKQVTVVALAFVAAKGSALLGVNLPSGLLGVDATTLNAAFTALAALLLHKLHKTSE